jgi:hypothetical protein
MVINALCLALGGLMIYGLTREQSWGKWLAGACFALLLMFQIGGPDNGCHTDWDGHSNPTVCD